MQSSESQIVTFTIIISSLLILVLGVTTVLYIFLFLKKKYRHQKELFELRETFNQVLLRSRLEIQEQTLDHIAKELHANFSHLASLININLAEILPQSSGDVKDCVAETKSLAKQLMSELKALSASLNTDHIMHIGFAKAFENELARLGKLKKYEITFTKTGQQYSLRPEHEIILFRLCQEVLSNIIKYAKAKTVVAVINYSPDNFELTIKDDGVGFDTDQAERLSADKESTGLLNIKKRARLINAEIFINSQPGKGTEIKIIVPKNL